MDLLGIDVVIDSNTGKYGIIDVNAFPSKLITFTCSVFSWGFFVFSWDTRKGVDNVFEK